MLLPCGCPSDYPDWHQREVDLGGTCVHVLGIPTLIHMPLAYEAYLKRQQREVFELGLQEKWPGLVLTRTGFVRGSITRLLDAGESPAHRVTYLPRPFHVRGTLHKGDVGTIRNGVRESQATLFDTGKKPRELYLCYLTCPTCQDERGGAKILLLRRFEESARLARAVSKQPRQ